MIVGISGRMRHGKDSIAEQLISRWGFVRVFFSSALKEEVLERLPRTLAAIHRLSRCLCVTHRIEDAIRADVYERKPPGVRELLQEYGTDVRRRDDRDYWVKRWIEEARRHDRVVVPDVRFPNEAQAVLDAGGELWKVVRPNYAETSSHASETALDGWTRWNRTIINDGSLLRLWEKVDAIMERPGKCCPSFAEDLGLGEIHDPSCEKRYRLPGSLSQFEYEDEGGD